MRTRVFVGIAQFLLLACVVFAAVPGVADSVSDILTIKNPQGHIVHQVVALESQEDNGTNTFFIQAAGFEDDMQFGNATVLCQTLPCDKTSPTSNFSDIFGVVQIAPGDFRLGFSSDGENGTAFGTFGAIFLNEVGGKVYDATMYLNAAHRHAGFTATFVSDSEVPPVPEPTSLLLLGSGLLGLAGYSRRFLR